MEQEKIMQIEELEQEFTQLNQQMQLIEQNILEIQELNRCLEEIDKTDEKNMLANLGKGIYIPVEIKDKKLIVEVGNKNFVKKSIADTKKIIEEQHKKLIAAKNSVKGRLEQLQGEIECLMYHNHDNNDNHAHENYNHEKEEE